MGDAAADLSNAVTKITSAVTEGATVLKSIADTLAAMLPVNGGGGVPTSAVEDAVGKLNSLADNFSAAVSAAQQEVNPAPPSPPTT